MENCLQHHGIKGQKWGRRRYQNKNGTLTPAGKKRYGDWSEDARTAKELRKKSVAQMSNAELRKLNERRNLERTYYSNLKPSHINKGIAFIGATAGAMNAAINLYNNSDKLIAIGKKFIRG